MTEKSHIFLAGASRNLGLEIAKSLAAQKMQVTALLRSPATTTELEGMGIKVVTGDALDTGILPVHKMLQDLALKNQRA